jgi:hypothetical protein
MERVDEEAVVAADIGDEQFPSEYRVIISPASISEMITVGVVEVPEVGDGCMVKLLVTKL